MEMKNPSHPGALIKEICLNELGLTVTAAAKVLGVQRQTLNNLVNQKSALSPEMAIRLEMAFGSSADAWLRMQSAYDLSQARKSVGSLRIQRLASA
jgi:addiction module HigA family antidote